MREQITSVSNSTQTLVLDVGKVKTPIELNVNQETDYLALSITLIVTVIVSAITAYVTIYLVTKSNSNLIQNQNQQNENQLCKQDELLNRQIESQEKQKDKELQAQYKQIWIDKMRDLASRFMFNANKIPLSVLDAVNNSNINIVSNGSNKELVASKHKFISSLFENMELAQVTLELSLNSKDNIDAEIKQLLLNSVNLSKEIYSKAFTEFTSKINHRLISFEDLNTIPQLEQFYITQINLKYKFIELIQVERDFIDKQ